MTLTHERLCEVLSYEPDTGIWRYKTRRSSWTPIGKRAGCLIAAGYRLLSIDKKLYRSARLAFFYMTGKWPPNHIDHINGLRDDDRWDNLRLATFSQNNANREKNKNNSSGYKGVRWESRRGKWRSRLMFGGKIMHLGYFESREAAAAAYATAAQKAFGEYVRL